MLGHLSKVHIDVLAGTLMQFSTTDLLGEVGNADGVAGVQLLHQEVAAGTDDAVDLVHDSTIHDMEHALLAHGDGGCVGELDETLHDFGVDALNGHHLHALLPQPVGEHGLENGAGRGQHHLVGHELGGRCVLVLDLQRDITQLLAEPQLVHDAKSLLGVVLQCVAKGAVAMLGRCHLSLALGGGVHHCVPCPFGAL